MKIKLDIANDEKIARALADINGKAVTHAITTHDDLADIAGRWIAQMENHGLLVKERAGAELVYIPAGPSARAYKHRAITTRVYLTIGANGRDVYLTGADRVNVYPKAAEIFRRKLTAFNKAAWLRRISDQYMADDLITI